MTSTTQTTAKSRTLMLQVLRGNPNTESIQAILACISIKMNPKNREYDLRELHATNTNQSLAANDKHECGQGESSQQSSESTLETPANNNAPSYSHQTKHSQPQRSFQTPFHPRHEIPELRHVGAPQQFPHTLHREHLNQNPAMLWGYPWQQSFSQPSNYFMHPINVVPRGQGSFQTFPLHPWGPLLMHPHLQYVQPQMTCPVVGPGLMGNFSDSPQRLQGSTNQSTAGHQAAEKQSVDFEQSFSANSAKVDNFSILGARDVSQFHVHGNMYCYGTDEKTSTSFNLRGDKDVEMQGLLKKVTMELCVTKSYQVLTGQQIEVCPVLIMDKPSKEVYPAGSKPLQGQKQTNFPQYSDQDGHYNRSKDYEKVDFKQESKVSVEQLFARADEAANRVGQSKYANIVALIGQPGIGKTTLSKVITEKALSGEMKTVEDVQYCFYISMKNIDFKTPTTFVSFLLKNSLPADCYSKSPFKKDNELRFLHLLLGSKHIFVSMDGLDEAATDWNLKYRNVDPEVDNDPLLYVYALMRGDLLKDAKKLFTSRQKHFFLIDANNRPLFVAEVMGLNEKSQEKLCNQICKDNGAQVWNVIKSNPNFMYSCYVPAKCIFIAFVIWKSLKEGGDGRFHSLTHVFANGFKYYFKQDFVRGETTESEKQEYLNKIAKLAWNGFENRKTVFAIDDLAAVGIDHQALSGLLATFVTEENWNMKFICSEIMSNFSHLIWQEYFAACYLVFFLPADEVNKLLPRLRVPRWEVVAKFVFGLCNDKVAEVVKDCFYNPNYQEMSEKRITLKKFLIDQLQETKTDGKSVLQICSWLQEIDDRTLYVEAVELFPKTLTLTGSILLTDVHSIGCVVRRSEKSFNIKVLKGCKFHHESFGVLLTAISGHLQDFAISHEATDKQLRDLAKHCLAIEGCLEIDSQNRNVLEPSFSRNIFTTFANNFQPTIKVPSLTFTGFKLDEKSGSTVSSCVKVTKSLSLSACKVSGYIIQNINMELHKLCTPFDLLEFRNTQIEDEYSLASCVRLVKNLSLSGCNISCSGMCDIFSIATRLNKKMESLDVSGNFISKSVVKMFLSTDVVKNIDKLYVTKFKISENSLECLGKIDLYSDKSEVCGVDPLNYYIEAAFELNPAATRLVCDGDEKTYALSCVIHLFPPTLGLTIKSASDLAIMEVVKSSVKMEFLDLSGNRISTSLLTMLLDEACINNFNKLFVAKFKILENGIEIDGKVDLIAEKSLLAESRFPPERIVEKYIESAFEVQATPMKLVVKGDMEACALSFVLHLFPSTLEVKMEKVGNFAIQEVVKSVKSKMSSLNLSGNTVNDESASTIASCVQWIDKLSLGGCNVTTAGMCKIASSISQLQRPMRVLSLQGNDIGGDVANALLQSAHKIQQELVVSRNRIDPTFEKRFTALPQPKPKLSILVIKVTATVSRPVVKQNPTKK